MAEVGYKAGQHELLAELYTRQLAGQLKAKVKEERQAVERLRKELRRAEEEEEAAERALEKVAGRETRARQDWLAAGRAAARAEADTTLSRREVERARGCEREKACAAGEVAQQLERARAAAEAGRASQHCSALLDSLQNMAGGAGGLVQTVLARAAAAEREAELVVAACTTEQARLAATIAPQADTEAVVERYKTGAAPATAVRKAKSTTRLSEKDGAVPAYQQKRILERKIETLEGEIARGWWNGI